MKCKKLMSYFLFLVYIYMLSHTVMPHDHHVHDTVEILTELVTHHDHADDDHSHDHHQHEGHDEHQLPHHDESQHVEDYIRANFQLQLTLALTAYYEKNPTFDFTPQVVDIKSTDYIYIPSKIPISYSSAVPLRAPPVC